MAGDLFSRLTTCIHLFYYLLLAFTTEIRKDCYLSFQFIELAHDARRTIRSHILSAIMGRRLVWEAVQYWLPLLSVVIFCYASCVLGFPTGAGSCIGGAAAVGGQHLQPGAIAASFVDRGIGIAIGGTPVTPGQNLGLISGDELEVVITASTNLFRGALIRLEPGQGQSVLGGLTPGTNAAVATICQAPVVGITHFNNETKTTFTGTLRVETLGPATLDITVVEINSATQSIYMYGGYNIVFVSSPGVTGASKILQRISIVFYFS